MTPSAAWTSGGPFEILYCECAVLYSDGVAGKVEVLTLRTHTLNQFDIPGQKEDEMCAHQDKQKLLDKIEREAAQHERELHACGRSALMALALNLNLMDENCINATLRAAIPLSGGIAGTRNHCGALLAGIMAIGLATVKSDPRKDTVEERKAAMAASKRLYRRFEKEIGHVRCFDIREVGLGRSFDTSDPGELKRFEEAGGFVFCSSVVGKAARMAAEIILRSE